ncbi:MAG: glycosyltransferase family 2 protein [Planctomycetota bacterium]
MPKKKRFQAERPRPDDPSMELLLKLAKDYPDESAYRVLTGAQKVAILLLLAGCAAWFIADRILFLTVVNAVLTTFYLVICAFKFYLIHLSLATTREMQFTPEEIASLKDEDLPVYSVLIPLYRETETLARLVDGLTKLDYPKDKLDVQLLLEEDDAATVEAVEGMDMPPFIRAVVTPHSQPKTKPKACNLGLAQAKGKYLVIYDGEDRPEPDQIKKAVLGFRQCPNDVICLQAKLNFYNPRQNLLTKWFTTEYSMWFDLFLPGLDYLGSPIPLGGTSNHFDIEKLRELLGWDAFNVTEDCDLGIRIAKKRYTTRMIDSTTWEEACSDLGFWIRQRSRWTKGYIQTYLVHWRHPLRLARNLGLRQSIGFHLMIGGTPLCLLINPVYWALTVVWFVWRWEMLGRLFPFPIILWALVCLFLGNFVFVYSCMLAAFRRGNYDLVKYGLFVPIYWVMMSLGAWKGFLQLLYKPTYWEKTKHGFDLAKGS